MRGREDSPTLALDAVVFLHKLCSKMAMGHLHVGMVVTGRTRTLMAKLTLLLLIPAQLVTFWFAVVGL